ncbi:MAG: type II toxin-antitoxin system RatA family toxin [Gammaproteobacteria bacterium]|nr:type II toxin-antitoxin system RatA family toxin [Gammaproteobacteria bacterium]
MHVVRKSALLPYSARQMFELVERVEDYPRFLPWCGSTEVARLDGSGVLATVTIEYRGIRQRFTTLNLNRPHEAISMRLREGPFARLEGEWRFRSLREDACKVEFSLDYVFARGVLGRALAPVFDQIARSFVDAFVRRADQLYGG